MLPDKNQYRLQTLYCILIKEKQFKQSLTKKQTLDPTIYIYIKGKSSTVEKVEASPSNSVSLEHQPHIAA